MAAIAGGGIPYGNCTLGAVGLSKSIANNTRDRRTLNARPNPAYAPPLTLRSARLQPVLGRTTASTQPFFARSSPADHMLRTRTRTQTSPGTLTHARTQHTNKPRRRLIDSLIIIITHFADFVRCSNRGSQPFSNNKYDTHVANDPKSFIVPTTAASHVYFLVLHCFYTILLLGQ